MMFAYFKCARTTGSATPADNSLRYVIYSACFLYKARSTGAMGGDTRGSTKRLISDTIDKLQQASACSNDVGDRYSRLIRLLWRKRPGARLSIAEGADMSRPATAQGHGMTNVHHPGVGSHNEQQPVYDTNNVNTFSWLDLPAVGEFALTNNESISGSYDGFDESSADGFGGFEQMNMMPQYHWNNVSPSGMIF